MTPLDLLPPGMGVDDLIILSACLAVVANAFLVYRVMLVRDPLAARIKGLNERRERLRAELRAPQRRTQRDRSLGFMKQVVNRFNLLRSKEAKKAGEKLMKAGYRSSDALTIYFFMKLALPFVFGGMAAIFCYVLDVFKLSQMQEILVCFGAVIAGAFGPEVFLSNTISKRKVRLRRGLPDALDLLVICAEAGQTLDASLARVASEIGPTHPDIADELHLTSIELGLLPERREALENLNKRTDIPGIRGIVNTLFQSEKYGTPLAQSLRVLSAEFRNERMMRAEEKAARLPAVMTVPMIIFILPPLFVVLLGPAALRIVDMFSKMTS